MNSRGPLPQFDSIRGKAGTNGAAVEFIQEAVIAPSWLNAKQRREFENIIDLQQRAGVGTRQADAEQYAQYVLLVHDFRAAASPEARQKARRCMSALEDRLVIGEYARQRVGIRGKKPTAKGKLAVMMAMKNGTDGLLEPVEG